MNAPEYTKGQIIVAKIEAEEAIMGEIMSGYLKPDSAWHYTIAHKGHHTAFEVKESDIVYISKEGNWESVSDGGKSGVYSLS